MVAKKDPLMTVSIQIPVTSVGDIEHVDKVLRVLHGVKPKAVATTEESFLGDDDADETAPKTRRKRATKTTPKRKKSTRRKAAPKRRAEVEEEEDDLEEEEIDEEEDDLEEEEEEAPKPRRRKKATAKKTSAASAKKLRDRVMQAVADKIETDGPASVKAVFSEFGKKRIGEFDEADFPDLLAALEEQ